MEQFRKKLNTAELQEILDCFVILTGIRAAYMDAGSESVTGSNLKSCSFCNSVRKYAPIDEGCRICDEHAFKTAGGRRKTYLYTCHMGLWEAVVPLYVNDILTGFLMLGQVRGDSIKEGWAVPEKKLKDIGIADQEVYKIKEEYECMPQYSREKIEASAKMLELMSNYIVHSEIIDLYISHKAEQVKQYINLHFKEHISTRALACQLKISQTALCRALRKEIGLSATEYADTLRIRAAKELLKTTDLSVKEIAFQLGYADQNYFSRRFKKKSGLSPWNYRKKFE